MKQILHYSLLAAAAVFFISCTKQSASTNEEGIAPKDPQDETPVTPTEYDPSEYLLSFGAAFEEDTKVSIDVDGGTLSFEGGDKVRVYVPETTAESVYVYDNEQSLFVPDQGQEPVAVGNNVAYVYYPSAEFTISSETVTFTMPEAIAAGSAEDLGDKVPMAGIIPVGAKEDGHPLVTFKNLGSILRARFNSSAEHGETITAVELSVTGANITGAGTVGWSGVTDTAVPSVSALGGETSITISVADGHLTSGAYKDFYFFLPASGELTAMTIKAVYGKTGGYEPYETVSRNSTMTLERNKIYKVQKSLSGFFSGGDGSTTYPYIIGSEEDFDNIYSYWNHTTADDAIGYNGTDTFFGHANYKQMAATIDKDGDTYNVIGTSGKPFTGVYDGDGKTISNVTIGSGNNLGIFGYTSGATIKNWKANNISVTGTGAARGAFIGYMAGGEVNDCDITGTSSVSGNLAGVGGIVGRVQGAPGTITACNSTASVDNTSNSNNATGGIVGLIYTDADGSEVSSCTVSGNVSGASCNYIGGIVGRFVAPGTLTACTTTAEKEVSGNNSVGGIAGQINTDVLVKDCKNYAAVSGASNIGGLVGLMSNGAITTTQSINYGKVTGTGGNVGGLVGEKDAGDIYTGATNNGDVEGLYNVGGLVGLQTAGATRVCFNNGAVTATGKDGQNWANVGGIIGRMDGGEVGRVSGAYQAENNGLVTASAGNGCGGVVGVMTNGTVAYAHSIKEVKGIHHVGGIVGILRGGAVRNCYNACNVTCTGNCIGGIVGNMQAGTVNSCYTTNGITIKGTYRIGGIVGYLTTSQGASVVINCGARSTVQATYNTANNQTYGVAGGIVGELKSSGTTNRGVLANSVALAAKVFGAANNIPCGGVIGKIDADNKGYSFVDNCYSQANSDAFIGYSTDGTTVQNCTNYSGGVYGYLKKGTVMDCYYTNGGSSNPKAGTVTTTTDDINTFGGSNGVTQISNYVKNGTATISVNEYHYYSGSSITTQGIASKAYYLFEVMTIGTYMNETSERQPYTSSAGTETCSTWMAIESNASYKIAYPKTLYDLGANYRP